jgi:phage-related tail fiber protein
MSVPIGTILPYYGGDNQPASGYLFCNGDPFSRTQFPDLYNHLTLANTALIIDAERAHLPDLRGEFIRGWDNDREVDPGRNLGTFQADELRTHAHIVPHNVQTFIPNAGGGFHSLDGGPDRNIGNPSTTSTGGIETRPRNIAVNFIIRAIPA